MVAYLAVVTAYVSAALLTAIGVHLQILSGVTGVKHTVAEAAGLLGGRYCLTGVCPS
jgi:hypothetical protein